MSKANRRKPRTCACLLACLWLALGEVHAQQPAQSPSGAAPPAPTREIPTLDKVQALRPEEEILELYRFQNPITVDPKRFNKAYDPGISPEDVALHYGGYVNYGINKGLYEAWQGSRKSPACAPRSSP